MQFQPESFAMPTVVIFDAPALMLAAVTMAIVLRVPTTVGFHLVQVLFDKMLGGRRSSSVGFPTVKRPTVTGGSTGGSAGSGTGTIGGGSGGTLGR